MRSKSLLWLNSIYKIESLNSFFVRQFFVLYGFFEFVFVRNDVTRLALDTLTVLTVCVESQLALIEPVTLPTGVTEIGIRYVRDY